MYIPVEALAGRCTSQSRHWQVRDEAQHDVPSGSQAAVAARNVTVWKQLAAAVAAARVTVWKQQQAAIAAHDVTVVPERLAGQIAIHDSQARASSC
jgi:hypothetical protein